MKMVFPCFERVVNKFLKWAVASGSIPIVGSSIMRTMGSLTRARAKESL